MMKVKDEYRHFVAIVAGDNPEDNMSPFDMGKYTDEPYVVYKFKDAGKIRKDYIEFYETLLSGDGILDDDEKREISEDLESIKKQDDISFFYGITDDCEYDIGTGDAISRKNPNGRWVSFELGRRFSVPFVLKDGTESFQAKKGDIDWEKIHLHGQEIYESAWDLVMDGKKPDGPQEEEIFENMKNRTGYFSKFGTRENYVISSTAFWGMAFVTDNSWNELEDDMDQFEWMSGFYDTFIAPLPDDTLLTIYECVRD